MFNLMGIIIGNGLQRIETDYYRGLRTSLVCALHEPCNLDIALVITKMAQCQNVAKKKVSRI